MATTVHCKSFLPGYFSMRDLNEDSSSSSWPQLNGDSTGANGQYVNGFIPRMTVDGYPGYDKDALKQKMIEHDQVFRNQVHELHRVYRLQRDMMEEARRKELHKQASLEPSSSSNLPGFQMPSERHMTDFPQSYSSCGRTSILGIEITNPPSSCLKRNDRQLSHFMYQNGFTSRDSEASDLRPLKVRKKLFDLQLPAEEYVDSEGENILDYKAPDISSYSPDGNKKFVPQNRMKLIFGNCSGVNVNDATGVSASKTCLKASTVLADLNEPIQIEDAMASPVELHDRASINGELKGMNSSANLNGSFVEGINDGFFANSSIYGKVNKCGPVSHAYESGSNYTLGSTSQGIEHDILRMRSHSLQHMLNPLHPLSGIYPTVSRKEDLQRDGPFFVELSDKNCDLSRNCRLEPVVASTSSYPFFSSPHFTASLSHPVSSRLTPNGSFMQQLIASESPFSSPTSLNRRLPPSAQSQEPYTGIWQANLSSRLNSNLGNEGTHTNVFFHGTASGSKDRQILRTSAGFGYVNSIRDEKVVSEKLASQGFGNFANGSCREESKPVLDINLNEVAVNSSNEPALLQDLNMVDGKCNPNDNHLTLPWLKPKTHGHERDLEPSSNQFWHKHEAVRDLNEPFMLASTDCEIVRKKEISEIQDVKNIQRFPIVDTIVPKKEPSFLVSLSSVVDRHSGKYNAKEKRKNIIIDINLACEPEEQISDEELIMIKREKAAIFFDLNSCASDCEDPPVPSTESQSNSVKAVLEIDLEAPANLEREDDSLPSKETLPHILCIQSLENKVEPTSNDVLRIAADTILAISSYSTQANVEVSTYHPSETSLADSLLWFVDAVSSCAVELDQRSGKESIGRNGSQSQDMTNNNDEFESMTLQLIETKEEDYLPKHCIPELQIEDDVKVSHVTRGRRGQSRRGRQRRDFQRDTLPGLASLSRLEVTEDLQTFGGLMRATGHLWNSGLTRRNSGRSRGPRGRRRGVVETTSAVIRTTVCTPSMQQVNKTEAGLEDRSLSGWGKTTRRPRRQRCPAGNPPAVALT